MTIQQINLGTYANDGTGDDLRTAFQKVNANFQELYSEAAISTAVNLGPGVPIFKDKAGINLEFKTLTSGDTSVAFATTGTTVDLSAKTRLVTDGTPQLGANLDLNGFNLGGGDVQTTVFGYDIKLLEAIVELLVRSNTVNMDFGSIYPESKTSWPVDFGVWTFGQPQPANKIDFGTFA